MKPKLERRWWIVEVNDGAGWFEFGDGTSTRAAAVQLAKHSSMRKRRVVKFETTRTIEQTFEALCPGR